MASDNRKALERARMQQSSGYLDMEGFNEWVDVIDSESGRAKMRRYLDLE